MASWCLTVFSLAALGQAEGPVRDTEVSAALGVRSSSYAISGGRMGQASGMLEAEGRWAWKLLSIEGGLAGVLPLQGGLSDGDGTGVLRVGVTHPAFSVTAGAWLNVTTSAPQGKFILLPSLAAAVRLGEVVASLGVFDRADGVPARLSVEWRGLGAGWVFPLGGELFGRLPLTANVSLEGRVFAFSVFNTLNVTGLVGVVLR
jgi:hypothetical protein